jgi:hypothetical protein
MRLGTRSLLYGAHQFILHPIFVLLAWRRVYNGLPLPGSPLTRALVALVHDWGYWGCHTIDGRDGAYHPVIGAGIVRRLTRSDWWYDETLLHSRWFAARQGRNPSTFCWVDKLSVALMPSWLWASLALLSGEGQEYLNNPRYAQHAPGQRATLTALITRHQLIRKEVGEQMVTIGFLHMEAL